jgi:SAM-dependent methyltransferase
MLRVKSLVGKRFLDLGCGSGLSSLAAYRLGAEIVSVDYDPQCVACAEILRSRFASHERWTIRQGSVLDETMMQTLEPADIVYSWGVLHHTGNMREAIRLAANRVGSGGLFFIAIYNDQGGASRRWLKIKQLYNRLPKMLRPAWVAFVAGVYELKFATVRAAQFRNPLPLGDWKQKKADRGMSAWYDWVDWVGGLPFEVAKVEEIIVPLREQGFVLENLKTVGNGWGCNEYVFRRQTPSNAANSVHR